MSYKIIEVDGLPVEVDAEEYERSPEEVADAVREARAVHRLPESEPQAPNYEERVGEDS